MRLNTSRAGFGTFASAVARARASTGSVKSRASAASTSCACIPASTRIPRSRAFRKSRTFVASFRITPWVASAATVASNSTSNARAQRAPRA